MVVNFLEAELAAIPMDFIKLDIIFLSSFVIASSRRVTLNNVFIAFVTGSGF